MGPIFWLRRNLDKWPPFDLSSELKFFCPSDLIWRGSVNVSMYLSSWLLNKEHKGCPATHDCSNEASEWKAIESRTIFLFLRFFCPACLLVRSLSCLLSVWSSVVFPKSVSRVSFKADASWHWRYDWIVNAWWGAMGMDRFHRHTRGRTNSLKCARPQSHMSSHKINIRGRWWTMTALIGGFHIWRPHTFRDFFTLSPLSPSVRTSYVEAPRGGQYRPKYSRSCWDVCGDRGGGRGGSCRGYVPLGYVPHILP